MTAPVKGTDYNSVRELTLQIAPEATPGTAMTTGFLKLHALSLAVDAEFEADIETPRGARFPASQVLRRDVGRAAISGKPDFNELQILLDSALLKPVKTGTSPAPITRVYTVANVPSSETRQTYTVQMGDGDLCETYAGGLISDLQIVFDREAGISLSGNMALGALDTVASLASGGAEIAKAPMLSRYVDIYVADDPADLGDAGHKLLIPWNFTWGIQGRADEYWALNSAYAGPAFMDDGENLGYAGSLKVPTLTGLPTFLAKIRAGGLIYTRVEVKGAVIATGPTVYETLRIDQAWFVQGIAGDNYKNAYSKTINLVGAQSDEALWANSCEATLINLIA